MEDKRLDRLESKIDKIVDDISEIKITLGAQHVTLVEHTRRSTLAEENLGILRTELKPIQKHVAMVTGALKLIGLVSVVVGIIAGIVQIIAPIL